MNQQDWALIAQVKKMIQSLPDMEIPEKDCHIVIEADGCMEGWGGICKWKPKKHDPKTLEKVCAYASGKFEPIKTTIDAEIQAVIHSLDKFKIYYLDKKSVTIRTDCHAIVAFYDKTNNNKPSRARWLTFSDYISGIGIDVTFEHIAGKENILADRLSRLINIISMSRDEGYVTELLSAWREVNCPEKVMVIIERPVFKCACGLPTRRRVEYHEPCEGMIYFECPIHRCYTKIWEDSLEEYIRELARYRRIKRREKAIKEYEEECMRGQGLFTDEEISNMPIIDCIFPEGVTNITMHFRGLDLTDKDENEEDGNFSLEHMELYNSEEDGDL